MKQIFLLDKAQEGNIRKRNFEILNKINKSDADEKCVAFVN